MPNRQDDEAARYYKQGATVVQIADLQHRTPASVEESIRIVAAARTKAYAP